MQLGQSTTFASSTEMSSQAYTICSEPTEYPSNSVWTNQTNYGQ